jgi:leader peptidase (prepilin peptidase)/N-methyltransferase
MLAFLLIAVFGFGTIFGSLINVCIYRLPMEKSILWPSSRCGKCLQPIHWYDNIPLVSYLLLRGRCRTCGVSYSPRYFFIELFTGLIFAALFYLVVVLNIHDYAILRGERARIAALMLPSWQAWVLFGHHALLMSFLLVASFCDLDWREIPLSVTIPGTVLGLISAVLWAWPWPESAANVAALPAGSWTMLARPGIPHGLYPWPFWGPLPSWFAPGGNWQTGLATGLCGALVGTLMLRVIRFLFGWGMGVEALGLGDADLMMMAGSFLGWQPVVIAFFLGVPAGLFVGVGQLLSKGDNSLPYGPSLAIGIVTACLGWSWIGPRVFPLFFNGTLMIILVATSCVLMLIISFFLRLLKRSGPVVRILVLSSCVLLAIFGYVFVLLRH